MSKEQINFSRNIRKKNGERLAFMFEGISINSDIDIEKINKLLDSFINLKSHADMLSSISFIRTILEGIEEKKIIIEHDDKNSQEIVEYENGNLILFFKSITKQGKGKYSLTADYNPSEGLKTHFSDYGQKYIVDYPVIIDVDQEFNKLIEHIHLLKNVKPVSLNKDSMGIIEIYKLFYNENPDFSLPNINVRVQTMMSILAQFGVTLDTDYAFSMEQKTGMPTSMHLEQIVNNLFPFGEISDITDFPKLSERMEKVIKIVGERVREVIADSQFKDEVLITISKIIYAGRYNLSSSSNVKDLVDQTNCTPSDIETSQKLVRCIKAKLNDGE